MVETLHLLQKDASDDTMGYMKATYANSIFTIAPCMP